MKVLLFGFLLLAIFHISTSSLTNNEEFKDMWKLLDQIAEILDVPKYGVEDSSILETTMPENDSISTSHSHSHGSPDLENSSSSQCNSCSSSGSKPCQCSKTSPKQEQYIPPKNSPKTIQRIPTSPLINKPSNPARTTCHSCSSLSNIATEQKRDIEKTPVSTHQRLPTQERQNPSNNHPVHPVYPTQGTCNTHCSSFQLSDLPPLQPIPSLPLPPPCTYIVPNQWMGQCNYYKPAHY